MDRLFFYNPLLCSEMRQAQASGTCAFLSLPARLDSSKARRRRNAQRPPILYNKDVYFCDKDLLEHYKECMSVADFVWHITTAAKMDALLRRAPYN